MGFWNNPHISIGSINIFYTPPKFNSSPMKNNAWKMILSFWDCAYFKGKTFSLWKILGLYPKQRWVLLTWKVGHSSFWREKFRWWFPFDIRLGPGEYLSPQFRVVLEVTMSEANLKIGCFQIGDEGARSWGPGLVFRYK